MWDFLYTIFIAWCALIVSYIFLDCLFPSLSASDKKIYQRNLVIFDFFLFFNYYESQIGFLMILFWAIDTLLYHGENIFKMEKNSFQSEFSENTNKLFKNLAMLIITNIGIILLLGYCIYFKYTPYVKYYAALYISLILGFTASFPNVDYKYDYLFKFRFFVNTMFFFSIYYGYQMLQGEKVLNLDMDMDNSNY